MRIFLSWSGNSRVVAEALHEVIPRLFDEARAFMSTDIGAGALWATELERALSETDFGIVLATKANTSSRWLNYEAGALSRSFSGKRQVMPVLLIDYESPAEMEGPLSGFQLTLGTKEGFAEVIRTINESWLPRQIDSAIMAERIDRHWPKIDQAIQTVRHSQPGTHNRRSVEEMVNESLQLLRGLAAVEAHRSVASSELLSVLSTRMLEKVSGGGGAAGSWLRLDDAIQGLYDRIRYEFPPDFVVGVYPEGAFVGYLLWLIADREWPFLMAPDLDRDALPEEVRSLAAGMRRLADPERQTRCLVVDASIKTGSTMKSTVEIVHAAAARVSLNLEVRTMCLSMRAGFSHEKWPIPHFLGMDGDFDISRLSG